MTFLAPIPALIAAAITVPALLVLYFLKLRRRPVRVSSTLLWDQAIRDLQVNVPFRLIRPTWLLFLQLLILALFLMALARPAIELAGGSPTRVVLLMDRSASMSAVDVGPDASPRSRLDAAKARAVARLEQLGGSGSTFGVVAFASEPVLVSSFASASAARAAIEAIEPSDQPGDLRAALQLAGALFSGDADESRLRTRGLAVLFSDGSFRGDEPLALAGAEFQYERIGPALPAEAAESSIPDTAEASPASGVYDNLGIVGIAARREWEDPASVRLFARITNASARPVTTTVTLLLDDREIDSLILTVPAAAASPGSAGATFRMDTREGGVATIGIARPDVLASDNSASLVIEPVSKARILVVIPDSPSSGQRFEWLITNIIEELTLPMRVMSAGIYEQEAGRELRYDLVIFDRVRPSSPPPVPTLSFGAGIGDIGVSGDSGRGTYFLSWDRNHPVLRNASLDGVHIARPLPVSGVEPEGELATGSSGPLIVESRGTGPRRIVAAFELSQTNWPVQVGFPIFIASAIDYLTLKGVDRIGKHFTTSQPVSIERSTEGAFALEGPRRVEGRGGPGSVSIGILDRAGVYRGADATVAVNLLDETESAVGATDSLRVSGQVVAGSAGDTGPREIWAWFVLAALILLALEWMINAWMMRA